MREGPTLVGVTPVQIGKRMPMPKKIRNVTPKYQELPSGTKVRASSGWVGEVLLDGQGSVVDLWTLREVAFGPPFPPFNQAIVDAVRQWKFEPQIVRGQRVPACTTVIVSIDGS